MLMKPKVYLPIQSTYFHRRYCNNHFHHSVDIQWYYAIAHFSYSVLSFYLFRYNTHTFRYHYIWNILSFSTLYFSYLQIQY